MASLMLRLSRVTLVFLPLSACDTPVAQPCEPSGTITRIAQASPPPAHATLDGWPNEPTGMSVVSDVSPGAWKENGWRCEGKGLSLAADVTAPMSASNAAVFTYQPGFPSGYAPGVAYYDLRTPTPETYFGFWWKPSDPWQSHPSGVNKIALLFPATSAGGTIYIMMFFDGTKFTIQVETTFASDTRRLAPNMTATQVVLGRWHQIEWYVRYSTTPASRDGVVRWWLDGVPQGAYTDLQMPPDAGFIEYTIRPVWGGGVGDTKKETDAYSYGRVHVSRR